MNRTVEKFCVEAIQRPYDGYSTTQVVALVASAIGGLAALAVFWLSEFIVPFLVRVRYYRAGEFAALFNIAVNNESEQKEEEELKAKRLSLRKNTRALLFATIIFVSLVCASSLIILLLSRTCWPSTSCRVVFPILVTCLFALAAVVSSVMDYVEYVIGIKAQIAADGEIDFKEFATFQLIDRSCIWPDVVKVGLVLATLVTSSVLGVIELRSACDFGELSAMKAALYLPLVATGFTIMRLILLCLGLDKWLEVLQWVVLLVVGASVEKSDTGKIFGALYSVCVSYVANRLFFRKITQQVTLFELLYKLFRCFRCFPFGFVGK